MTEPLGTRVRQARKRYGMSAAELARRVDITRQQIYMIESNKSPDPGVLTVKAIADVLGVSVDSLLRPAEKPPSPAVTATRQETPAPAPTTRRTGHARNGTHAKTAPLTAQPDAASLRAPTMCPHCAMPMQPLGDGSRVGCPGCRYSVAGAT
jgi:transcriptional regulator with XRE-family HTH domain